MPLMLPAGSAHARSLTDVLPDVVAALTGGESSFAPATSAIVFVIDGLGALQLRANAGHGRFLSARMGKKDVARSVFPSTTAAALTSLTTGAPVGQHGLVGYSALDPARDVVVNQLTGWESAGLDPATWQRVPTVFEHATSVSSFTVGLAQYATSGFTRAILRGAQYVAAATPAERVRAAVELASTNERALVYCYLPELDKAGHKHGVASDQWVSALEIVDSALATAATLPPGVGAIVTADHGMIDVPAHRHVLLAAGDERLDGVAHIGGEPRMLHVYLEKGQDADASARRWEALSGPAADVATRDQAIAAGLFGTVAPDVRPRIGDVLVAARATWAFYDDRPSDKRSQGMIGQHGSLTPEETIVPHVRLGVFAR